MSNPPPVIRPPTETQLSELAARFNFELSSEELDLFASSVDDTLEKYERLEALKSSTERTSVGDRDDGYRPDKNEDPLNVFVTECEVSQTVDGPLASYEVGIKDNIAVAGVEMTAGSRVLEGHVPTRDATVVTRLLNAGASITGKTNMDDLAAGGSGELSAFGPVINPRDDDHLAAGSSSGSAAAVVAGDVDIALGTDQGGSVRNPAAACGCVGLKPTYGLVPYTGAIQMGTTFDHIGPLAMSVQDIATTLKVIAGEDSLDPRQRDVQTTDYTDALKTDPEDATVGVLTEGFDDGEVTEMVQATVREALDEFSGGGATVHEVSIPFHNDALAIWRGIVLEEVVATIRSDGIGRFTRGAYSERLANAFGKARRVQADAFPPTLKVMLLTGEYLSDNQRSRYYARAQTLRRDLRHAYDAALADIDVLAMPTRRDVALERSEELSLQEFLERGQAAFQNRAAFNITGHPAISVPCGTVNGLPVGIEFVGNRFDDATVLKVAHAFERTVNWQS